MAIGTLRAGYELLTPGLRLQAVLEARPWLGADRVAMRPNEEGVQIDVEFGGVSEADGHRRADAFSPRVQELARHLTLRFADRLTGPVTTTALGRTFLADTGDSNFFIATAPMVLASAPPVRLVAPLTRSELDDALLEFERGHATVNPHFASALEMYWVAVHAEHAVARFLVLYSALAVFVMSKGRPGVQGNVDAVLWGEDPTLPRVTGPRGDETIYTAARNRLIHSEDRGRDPAAASAEVERLTPEFQRLAARILRKG